MFWIAKYGLKTSNYFIVWCKVYFSISRTVYVWFTSVTNWRTDRQTDRHS